MKIVKLLQSHRYLLLMIFAILLALWPLSFFVLTPKWDNVDAFLPYRYFISDYLWNGHFPFWNSFQLYGYPAYPDPQSGIWNPITWVIMLFGKYTMKSLIVELLIYFVLAGTGMYWLSNAVLKNKGVASIIGLSYALSGAFVGSAQLMVFLAGSAWLPWCVFALYKYSKHFEYRYIVLAGVLFSLNTVAASPAYTIVLFYIFVIWFVHLFWIHRKNRVLIKKIFLQGALLVGVILVLLLPYIVSLVEFSPYFQRTSKLPYYGGHILRNPFTLVSYLSFVFPYGVISNSPIFDITSSTLRNGYIGILGLFFFLYALIFSYRNKTVVYGFLGLVFFLIVASGGETFVYRILYYLPGFGTFSHPSFFKTYALLIMLLISGYGMVLFIKSERWKMLSEKRTIVVSVLVLIFGLGALILFSKSDIINAFDNLIALTEFSNLSLGTHVKFNLFVLLLIIGVVLLLKYWLRLALFTTFFLFAFLDLGVQTMLTFPATISYNIPYSEYHESFKSFPNDIHQPSVDQPLAYYNDNNGLIAIHGIWYNRSTFNKTISYKGYNPFKIKHFEDAHKDSSLSFNLANPLFFFAEAERKQGDSVQKGLVWGDVDFNINGIDLSTVETIEVGYNEFKASVVNQSNSAQWLLLNQNFYPRWKTFVDGVETPISLLNSHIMGIQVPPDGKSNISFKYHAPYIVYLAIVNIIAYILVLLYCIKVFLYPKRIGFKQETKRK
ncbi:MAG TPA: hypothetical protein VFD77_00430 [Brumimicrobium sp.]|nr:hypothetical protein [Brumimicrobium sp.]